MGLPVRCRARVWAGWCSAPRAATLRCGDVELGMAQDQAAFVLAVDAGTQADGSGSLFVAASGIDGADQMTHQLNATAQR